MVLRTDPLYAEAVFFLDDIEVVKEMLFVEFQAVLDGVVGIPEFSSKQFNGAYASIWRDLSLHTVVLFQIEFDSSGHVVSSWNLPLRYLASRATAGPELGGKSILIMSQEHCEDEEYTQDLWNVERNQLEVLTAVRDTVTRNHLALYTDGENSRFTGFSLANRFQADPPAGLTSGSLINDDYQEQLIVNIEATLKFKYEQKLKTLAQQHKEIVTQLESQASVLRKEREEFSLEYRQIEAEHQNKVKALQGSYQKKLKQELAKIAEELSQQIGVKEMELSYSEENVQQLREELEAMAATLVQVKLDAVEDYLGELLDSAIELIVTQKGVGSYSLKPEQVERYLTNPTGFWATQCGISEITFLGWYDHYRDPTCSAGQSTGVACGEPIALVNEPKRFEPGFSDRCFQHQLKKINEGF